jgi:hypothetical protein
LDLNYLKMSEKGRPNSTSKVKNRSKGKIILDLDEQVFKRQNSEKS